MNAEDLIALNEQIASMARAGLPMDQGLAALADEMGRGRLRRVTSAIAEDLREGRTLPEALRRHERDLPPFYAGLVSAGVRTGRVDQVLVNLTTYARSIADLRAIVAQALFYPALVLVIVLGIVSVFSFFLVPRFEAIFRDFGMRLPALTEFIIDISRHPVEFFVLPLVGVPAVLLVGKLVLGSSERGRRLWARFVYTIPIAGTLVRSSRLAAFTDLLAILIDHDTPLPEAFRLAGAASSDPVMAAASQRIHEDLENGVPLAQALRNGGLVPQWVSWMAGLGERRGHLGQALHQIAEMYRRQVEMRAALLRSVLPPFLVVCIAGVCLAVYVVAMFLPLVKLLEGLSK